MTTHGPSPAEATVRRFVAAIPEADYDTMAQCLAEDAHCYITNASGGVNLLRGRDAFIANIRTLDVETVRPSANITQLLEIKADQVLVMIEVKAERKGRKLHNFAAYLIDLRDGAIARLYMVEALPAYSDAFWKD